MPKFDTYDIEPNHPDHKIMVTNGNPLSLKPLGSTVRVTVESIQNDITDAINLDGGIIM